MPLPGQYFCKSCMKPIQNVRNEGLCDSCLVKQMQIIKAGNYCDHCKTPASKSLIYINLKTKKRYCTECRAVFYKSLIEQGFKPEDANKILLKDFVLVNDPLKKPKVRK